ncbi:hypothetical protein [Dyella silvae]|nr:hypothetical protein [Dyella silvae]
MMPADSGETYPPGRFSTTTAASGWQQWVAQGSNQLAIQMAGIGYMAICL